MWPTTGPDVSDHGFRLTEHTVDFSLRSVRDGACRDQCTRHPYFPPCCRFQGENRNIPTANNTNRDVDRLRAMKMPRMPPGWPPTPVHKLAVGGDPEKGKDLASQPTLNPRCGLHPLHERLNAWSAPRFAKALKRATELRGGKPSSF